MGVPTAIATAVVREASQPIERPVQDAGHLRLKRGFEIMVLLTEPCPRRQQEQDTPDDGDRGVAQFGQFVRDDVQSGARQLGRSIGLCTCG